MDDSSLRAHDILSSCTSMYALIPYPPTSFHNTVSQMSRTCRISTIYPPSEPSSTTFYPSVSTNASYAKVTTYSASSSYKNTDAGLVTISSPVWPSGPFPNSSDKMIIAAKTDLFCLSDILGPIVASTCGINRGFNVAYAYGVTQSSSTPKLKGHAYSTICEPDSDEVTWSAQWIRGRPSPPYARHTCTVSQPQLISKYRSNHLFNTG
ncbi:uncharacterized protein BT62DRAFT_999607 [Guyanagaster necrorhizus]|uniref:Uncharacterized protein n=1 Tax=Guyanagaster necrorhizus TaxID=856835 RepID=A0A9P7W4B9_9AGAR|nr:uncharacterized protein BT62DRAFT_999607 [Guyanagaster necrorhizus MCA 3950]KAG7451874.1 hypothetical protein BT62DRAFT_999607 [Guyanagaster necrorhizus MCA 3950]